MSTRPGRHWGALTVTLSGLIIAGIGLLFLLTGLDNADRISSGIGAATGAIGLVIGILGTLRARSARANTTNPHITVRADATDNAHVFQVGHGSMNIGQEPRPASEEDRQAM